MLYPNRAFKIQVRTISTDDDHIPDFVHTISMDRHLAAEALAADMALWTPGNPVLLDFPTGTGKNYFVTHVLVPRAAEEGKMY